MKQCPDANPCAICRKLIVPEELHACTPPDLPPWWSRARIPVGLNGKKKTGIWDRDSWGSHTVLGRDP